MVERLLQDSGFDFQSLQGMEAHIYNPSIWETETGRSRVQNQPWLHREFKGSPGLYETLDKRRGVGVGGGNEDKKGKEERKREGERENRPRSKSLFLSFAALTSSNE